MAIETLDPLEAGNYNPATLLAKLNELIEEHNDLEALYEHHVHYARELQYPTHVPDDPQVYSRD